MLQGCGCFLSQHHCQGWRHRLSRLATDRASQPRGILVYASWSGSSSKVFIPIASLHLLRILCSDPGSVKNPSPGTDSEEFRARSSTLQSLVSSPGQNRLLPALSMGCLFPLLHSFGTEVLLTCKSGPRGVYLPIFSVPWALRQEDLKHYARPDCTVRPFFKNSGKRRLADRFCQGRFVLPPATSSCTHKPTSAWFSSACVVLSLQILSSFSHSSFPSDLLIDMPFPPSAVLTPFTQEFTWNHENIPIPGASQLT